MTKSKTYDNIDQISENDDAAIQLVIDDAELDRMFEQWAETDVEVPEDFHQQVMTKLRAEQQAVPQKKVLCLERFRNKKAWVSAIAAAALVVCCLPVLQSQQNHLAGVSDNVAQTYEMQKSRTAESDAAANQNVMMASLTDGTDSIAAANYSGDSAEKSTAAATPSYHDTVDYAIGEQAVAYDGATLTLEEQLAQANETIAELETQLQALDDATVYDTERETLETEIAELREKIKQLELQIENELNVPAAQ